MPYRYQFLCFGQRKIDLFVEQRTGTGNRRAIWEQVETRLMEEAKRSGTYVLHHRWTHQRIFRQHYL